MQHDNFPQGAEAELDVTEVGVVRLEEGHSFCF